MEWLSTSGAPGGSGRATGSARAGQLGLHQARRNGRGGYRANAGRKRVAKAGTPHRARPRLSRHVPVHITLRAVRGLPSFREQVVARAICHVIRAMRVVRRTSGSWSSPFKQTTYT